MDTTNSKKDQDPIVKEYTRLAEVYDRRWSFYVESTVRETMARLSLAPTARVLDVGCGTGVLLQALADQYPEAELTGIDPVPDMLTIARGRLPSTVELREDWAETLPFEEDCFDAVVSCSIFHYIRQPLAALKEMGRVLRPGGQIVITDWCGDYLTCRILDQYLRWFNAAHHRTYRQHELLELLRQAGNVQSEIERYKINWFWGLMTAKVIVAR